MTRQMKDADFPEEVVNAYKENGGTPWLDYRHTVFGQVVEGMDLVDLISDVPKGAQDRPVEDVVINTIKIVK